MSVKKVFVVLITIVACVVIGALVLNIFMPNVIKTGVNAVEDMVFKGTGMSFDINADGDAGNGGTTTYTGDQQDNEGGSAGVEGFN